MRNLIVIQVQDTFLGNNREVMQDNLGFIEVMACLTKEGWWIMFRTAGKQRFYIKS